MFERVTVALIFSIVFSSYSFAENKSFGNWIVGETKSSHYAVTTNESSSLIGVYCFPNNGNCFWHLGLDSSCTIGDRYPVLLNTDIGSYQLSITCSEKIDATSYLYVFSDFEEIDAPMRKASKAGFALPLQSDQFRVIRFNLEGSSQAIATMGANIAKKSKAKELSTQTKKDEVL